MAVMSSLFSNFFKSLLLVIIIFATMVPKVPAADEAVKVLKKELQGYLGGIWHPYSPWEQARITYTIRRLEARNTILPPRVFDKFTLLHVVKPFLCNLEASSAKKLYRVAFSFYSQVTFEEEFDNFSFTFNGTLATPMVNHFTVHFNEIIIQTAKLPLLQSSLNSTGCDKRIILAPVKVGSQQALLKIPVSGPNMGLALRQTFSDGDLLIFQEERGSIFVLKKA